MIRFIRALKVEFFKLKRSFAWWFVILAPLLMVLNGASNFNRFQSLFLAGGGAWLKLQVQIVLWYSILLLPLSIGVLSMLLNRMEHSENSWKHLLALPIPRSIVYLAKLTNQLILTGISLLILAIGIFVSGFMLGISDPVPYSSILKGIVTGWVACWPIVAIQFWLSIRFPGIGVPMGFSAATAISGVLLTQSKYGKFYLWSYPALSMLPSDQGIQVLTSIYLFVVSLGMFVVCTSFGLWEFNGRDIQ
ncbi:ABC transporter permease [Effusibacillus consociatus]|uniref:ABC transporter permease n=1 Tax=Effusibacillus consociatus TaxID=1117041 RepID=A0ABV9PZ60_9BACL